MEKLSLKNMNLVISKVYASRNASELNFGKECEINRLVLNQPWSVPAEETDLHCQRMNVLV